MKQQYKARWGQPGKPSTGNVSFDANSDDAAKKTADRIARELGLTNTPRTITNSNGATIECINSGVSQNKRQEDF